jgi:hypothetical protein
LFGTEKYKKEVRQEFLRSPLMFGDFRMIEKEQYMYLGDMLDTRGMAGSVEATIMKRLGRIKGVMYEVSAIMSDPRMQAMGGMAGAWDIWERSIIPSLLANCGSWVGISRKAIELADEAQNMYCRLIYSCPASTPKPVLRGEAGLLNCEHRIMLEKVCLVSRIMFFHTDEENYAREVLQEQLRQGWKGLAQEVVEICQKIGLPNACLQYVHRKEVAEAILISHLKVLKEEYKMEKLKHLQNTDIRYRQEYMRLKSLEYARIEFKYRSNMLDNRANMGKKYSEKYCPHCRAGRLEKVVETSQHWFECSAYEQLRRGLDPELVLDDRVKFISRVQQLRTVLEKSI